MGDGAFKGDRADLGPRLDRSRRNGLPGVWRQVREVGPAEVRPGQAARVERARAAVRGTKLCEHVAGMIEQAEGHGTYPAQATEARKGGRPREIEGRPWEAEGISRRTWERRRKEGRA